MNLLNFFLKIFRTFLNNDDAERIEAEFASYQFENFTEILCNRMDDCWHQISQIRNAFEQKKYIALPKLM